MRNLHRWRADRRTPRRDRTCVGEKLKFPSVSRELIPRVRRGAARAGEFAWLAVKDRRQRVAYVGGWRGHRNLGDEALFVAMQSLFERFMLVPFDGGTTSRWQVIATRSLRHGLLAGGMLNRFQRGWKAEKFYGTATLTGSEPVCQPDFW